MKPKENLNCFIKGLIFEKDEREVVIDPIHTLVEYEIYYEGGPGLTRKIYDDMIKELTRSRDTLIRDNAYST
jgi:hypothetical protein